MIKRGKSFGMNKRAFTLVELIVVLVILAVLAALDKDHSCRDWVLDSDGNKIYTVVYAIEHGPNANPAFNLSQMEQGTYGR